MLKLENRGKRRGYGGKKMERRGKLPFCGRMLRLEGERGEKIRRRPCKNCVCICQLVKGGKKNSFLYRKWARAAGNTLTGRERAHQVAGWPLDGRIETGTNQTERGGDWASGREWVSAGWKRERSLAGWLLGACYLSVSRSIYLTQLGWNRGKGIRERMSLNLAGRCIRARREREPFLNGMERWKRWLIWDDN